jgi:hypothetical protein
MFPNILYQVGKLNHLRQVKNLSSDQAVIIQLLWDIETSNGGQKTSDSLSILNGHNGLCPEALADAIWEFQSHWKARGILRNVDGVVDPGGASWRKMLSLNGLIAPPQNNFISQIYAVVPAAAARTLSAYTTLIWAQLGVSDAANPYNQKALKLVNRCFKIESSNKEQMKKDILQIRAVYDQIGIFLAAVIAGQRYLIESPGGHAGDNAYCFPGHWTKKDTSDGIWFVKASCNLKKATWLTDLLMHESAHFCGPLGSGEIGGDVYGNAALSLPRASALYNAANYAWFAGISQLSSERWESGVYA